MISKESIRLAAFIGGLLGQAQAERVMGELEHWSPDQFYRFGKLLGQSRQLREA